MENENIEQNPCQECNGTGSDYEQDENGETGDCKTCGGSGLETDW